MGTWGAAECDIGLFAPIDKLIPVNSNSGESDHHGKYLRYGVSHIAHPTLGFSSILSHHELLFPSISTSSCRPVAFLEPGAPPSRLVMLDSFEIVTTSGVVVWSRSFSQISPSIINNFIADTFIEEKGGFSAVAESRSASSNPAYKSDQHTLKWTLVKELGVIFVVSPRRLRGAPIFGRSHIHSPARPYTDRSFTCRGSTSLSTISEPSLSDYTANSSPSRTRP